ncbi:hypothetical protein [Bradyrhizobium prioriisuperbiae]|uniref:hypothetical protein n=1 Tax=Bradyrhizobium prioriisuperbiae TaxID=2854389 RepID=UPI0028E19A50|nr:hypothetical protein [Bradyrhizobium prioritasuperba]
MPLIPFGEYRPDVSDYEAQTTRNILNVLPRGDGYGPFPDMTVLSSALGAQCRGAFVAYQGNGTVTIFAATATDIYIMNNATFAWTKVSKGGGPYSALSSTEQWRFAQFNNLVIAVQANVVPQVYDIVSSSAFTDLAGSPAPPQARYIDIVGRFVVLSGLLQFPYRVQWSGLNDVNGPSSWTPGVNSADYQDLPDGGIVRGVAGGETGVILQDQAIRRMTYVPGSPVIFQIERVSQDKGLFGPYSLVRAGERIFFFSAQGFHRIDPGGFPTPIGRERVDRTFFADLDKANLQLFIGAADPRNSRVFWAYKSVNGTVSRFDKMLCYDWVLDRFTPIKILGEYLLPMSQPGLTLENLDAISTSLDALTTSLDDFSTSVTPELAAFDNAHALNFFRGPSLEATLDSAEQGTDGTRLKLRGFRPATDAPAVFGSVSRRETQAAVPVFGAESPIHPQTGKINLLASTRYARARVRIPASTAWSFIGGIEPDVVTEGKR